MPSKVALEKEKLKNSLLKQLENKGAKIEHFTNLIDDYMSMWDIKNKLIKDIKKRGIVYEGISASGYKQEKNNPSVKELVGVNRQMLSILKDLGLSTENAAAGNEDSEL